MLLVTYQISLDFAERHIMFCFWNIKKPSDFNQIDNNPVNLILKTVVVQIVFSIFQYFNYGITTLTLMMPYHLTE